MRIVAWKLCIISDIKCVNLIIFRCHGFVLSASSVPTSHRFPVPLRFTTKILNLKLRNFDSASRLQTQSLINRLEKTLQSNPNHAKSPGLPDRASLPPIHHNLNTIRNRPGLEIHASINISSPQSLLQTCIRLGHRQRYGRTTSLHRI